MIEPMRLKYACMTFNTAGPFAVKTWLDAQFLLRSSVSFINWQICLFYNFPFWIPTKRRSYLQPGKFPLLGSVYDVNALKNALCEAILNLVYFFRGFKPLNWNDILQ